MRSIKTARLQKPVSQVRILPGTRQRLFFKIGGAESTLIRRLWCDPTGQQPAYAHGRGPCKCPGPLTHARPRRCFRISTANFGSAGRYGLDRPPSSSRRLARDLYQPPYQLAADIHSLGLLVEILPTQPQQFRDPHPHRHENDDRVDEIIALAVLRCSLPSKPCNSPPPRRVGASRSTTQTRTRASWFPA